MSLADLTTVLKETTDATNETVQELKSDLACVKKQLADQQKLIAAMYRHDVDRGSLASPSDADSLVCYKVWPSQPLVVKGLTVF